MPAPLSLAAMARRVVAPAACNALTVGPMSARATIRSLPQNAIVICVDEKPSIQALERTQGYLKMPNGRALGGHSHDYKPNGTSTLFAAFEVATGKVTIWVEPIITVAVLSRLHFKWGWPKELIGTQSQKWEFDVTAYRASDLSNEY